MKKETATEPKKESKSLMLRGVLIQAMYGKRSFKKGGDKEDRYRYSLKLADGELEKLREAAAPYYKDTEEKWLPNWLTSEEPKEIEYINFSSHYDIMAGLKTEDMKEVEDLGNLVEDYIAKNGNISGSKVIMNITIKDGAVYPNAILIKELHKRTINDMFADCDDDLPF